MLWPIGLSIASFFKKIPLSKEIALCFISAGLCVLSFPLWEMQWFIWVGLVPLLLALHNKTPRLGFGLGYFWGVLFFLGTLYWFIHVTLVGMMMLVLYLAIYGGVWGWGVCFFSRLTIGLKVLTLASLWIVLEYLRGWLLSGFGWVYLGHSQYRQVMLIQIAEVTGVYGISFLIVVFNLWIKEIISFGFSKDRKLPGEFLFVSVMVVKGVILCLIFGWLCVQHFNRQALNSTPRLAIIQANIQQEDKWNPDQWPSIMDRYLNLSTQAIQQKPDLLIWPETAFPGFLWEAPELFLTLKDQIRQWQVPFLFGLVTQMQGRYYNSAMWLGSDGEVVSQYDKLHLVPFGEYIPLRKVFPFFEHLLPIADFTPGQEYKKFVLPLRESAKNFWFSVLICFEDTVPAISREFVKRGADILINLTNDAWFKDTAAPLMHLQAAVFRSVENRRTLVRCANTGVSCFINPWGKIYSQIQNLKGKNAYIDGFEVQPVFVSLEKTFYTKFGDVFAYSCFGVILWAFFRRLTKN